VWARAPTRRVDSEGCGAKRVRVTRLGERLACSAHLGQETRRTERVTVRRCVGGEQAHIISYLCLMTAYLLLLRACLT